MKMKGWTAALSGDAGPSGTLAMAVAIGIGVPAVLLVSFVVFLAAQSSWGWVETALGAAATGLAWAWGFVGRVPSSVIVGLVVLWVINRWTTAIAVSMNEQAQLLRDIRKDTRRERGE